MTGAKAQTAQPGDVEFCTLGMFILGMLIIFKTPLIQRSQCIAQMILNLVVPDRASRISLEAPPLSQW